MGRYTKSSFTPVYVAVYEMSAVGGETFSDVSDNLLVMASTPWDCLRKTYAVDRVVYRLTPVYEPIKMPVGGIQAIVGSRLGVCAICCSCLLGAAL